MGIRFRSCCTVAAAAFMLTACATRSSDYSVVSETFFHSRDIQKDQFCGPFSLSLLLRFYGITATQDEIGQQVFNDRGQGTESVDMLLFAQTHGLELFLQSGSLPQLLQLLHEEQAAIVAIKQDDQRKSHYLFVYGYNRTSVIAHDGVVPDRQISLSSFDDIWRAGGYLMIYKPQDAHISR